MTEITGTVATTITEGSGGYGGYVVITSKGEVAPTAGGANGVNVPGADYYLRNEGVIIAGSGNSGFSGGNGFAGGTGVSLTADLAILVNGGTVSGGSGGYGGDVTGFDFSNGGYGGAGSTGVSIKGSAYVLNNGTIKGGAGGHGGTSEFARGGKGGAGAAGVYLDGGTLNDFGTIEGGAGGAGGTGSAGSLGQGAAGDAVLFGSIASTLIIDPGAVIDGNVVANGVNDTLELGGTTTDSFTLPGSQFTGFSSLDIGSHWNVTGAVANLKSLQNSGTISQATGTAGTNGNPGTSGTAGAAGVTIAASETANNHGTITGGTGGASGYSSSGASGLAPRAAPGSA